MRSGANLRVMVRAMIVGALLLAALAASRSPAAVAAAPSAPWVVAVHVSSDKPPASGPEEMHAIREFVTRRVDMLNDAGGIRGRPVAVEFYDDRSDAAKTVDNVERTLADPRVIAILGIWNSTRGSNVVDRIGRSGIPFISEMSVESLFEGYPNIYTLTRSVRDEQEAFQGFAKAGYRRIAFVGAEEDLYTRDYHGHLEKMDGSTSLASTFWLKGNVDDRLPLVDEKIAEIKASGADLVFLSIGSKRGASFLRRMTMANVNLPVFIALGSIPGVLAEHGGQEYGGPLFEIAEGGIANLNNERLEQLMRRPDAVRSERSYSPYAVGYGARYADLVALLAEAAASADRQTEVETVRAAIARRLTQLAEGRSVWRGWAQDWSFTRERASSERSLLVWRLPGQPNSILAPYQYVRIGAAVQRVPVLYVHMDVARIYHVDSNDKSFDAEFFFTMRSATDVPIQAVEFTNAVRSRDSAVPIVSAREVHRDIGTDGETTRIYKVSGRFMFEPDLRKYPFDEQVFTISFQPARTSSAFFLQPPSEHMRGAPFAVDGWRIRSHYVGTNELIIRSVAGALSEERIIPYYNFNYTWVMKRQVVDYVLRVIVPLTFIMIVAYLAIFIPRQEFEAIIAIQVTALLSAIALYMALSQPNADDATLSDIIFVMTYATISIMIALSIFEVNTTLSQSASFMRVVHVVQVYLVPVAALALMGYVLLTASSNETLGEMMLQTWRRATQMAARL